MKKQVQYRIRSKGCLALLLAVFAVTLYGQDFVVDGIEYGITSTSPAEVEVVGYTGSATEVTIPPGVNYQRTGYTVIRIGSGAFQKNESDPHKLEKVTIPGSVTVIGTSAFAWNNLAEVTFTGSSHLDTIAASAFSHNQLTRIEIPNTVNFIGSSAFSYNQLTRANIPDGVSVIRNTVFVYNQLASIEIPNSVTTIEISAFGGNNLESVTIPEKVTSIGPWAFANNPALNTVHIKAINPPVVESDIFTTTSPPPHEDRNGQIDLIVPKGTKSAYSNWYGGNNYFKSITDVETGGTFIAGNITYKITSLAPHKVEVTDYTGTETGLIIPPEVNHQGTGYTVTAIGNGAFQKNESDPYKLEKVTIPGSVTAIGTGAFSRNNLAEVIFTGSSHLDTIAASAFSHNQLTRIEIPNTVNFIGSSAFSYNQLTRVNIPDGVSVITNTVFVYNQLASIEIPNRVTTIEISAFGGNNLESVTIPENVTSIGPWAFANNPALNTVHIKATNPPVVKNDIFTTTFNQFYPAPPNEDRKGQIDLIVPKGTKSAYSNWYGGNNYFKSITDEEAGGTFIVGNITYKITSLAPLEVMATGYNTAGGTMVTIPPTVNNGPNTYTVTAIGDRAFRASLLGGPKLTSVEIPNSIKRIGDDAFFDNNLTSIEIPNSVTSIGQVAFGSNLLTNVTIPGSVKSISRWMFYGNQLTEVTLSDGVDSIGYQAFYNNPGLTLVTVEANDPPVLDTTAFANRKQIDVFVPMDALDAYNEPTNGWTGFRSIKGPVESGDRFTVDHITYQVSNNIRSKTVGLMDYTGPGGVVTIPPTVDHGPNTFTVALIWIHSFRFANLTEVTIPGSVETIMPEAFRDNPNLTLVKVERNDPPRLRERAFQNPGRDQIDLVVPMGRRQAYLGKGWDGFRSISFGIFTVNDITYGITSPTEVMVVDYTGTDTEVEIPETVNDRGTNYTVTAIGNGAFQDKGLTGVTISSNVVSIGSNAFNDNPTLGVLEVEATDPPRLVAANAFTNRNQIDVFVPSDALDAYNEPANGWTGFRSITGRVEIGDRFTVDHITYQVANNTLHKTVGLMDYTGPGGVVTIPPTVEHGLDNFTVFLIWIHSFRFANLTEVTIPGSVEMIMPEAFRDNPNLTLVTVERNDPPILRERAFQDPGRDQIDLVVPTGRIQAYKDNGWDGFRSISDGTTPPQPTIDAPQSVDNLESFTVNITFDDEVTGFDLGDIQVTNATVSDLKGSGSTYTATLVPTSPCDDITIEVQANVAESTTTGFPNQAATQFIVAVVDTVDPTITCPADVVANTAHNGTGDCTTTVDLGNPAADDNCSVAAIVAQVNGMDIDPDTYAFGTGTTTVTWIVTDDTGNTASCEQDVTVEAVGNCASATFTINAIADVILRESTVYTSVTPSLYGDDPKGTVTWTLGGTDAEAFSIDSSTGVVTMTGRDFEAPADANADNVYEVSITATDSESNSSEISWTVTVQNDNLRFVLPWQETPYSPPVIPTAFTPNDDGANDTWIIDNLYEDASVRIYDRHGTIIFSSEDGYPHPWDGTSSRGRPLPPGSYLYAIQNGPHTYRGTVTILL